LEIGQVALRAGRNVIATSRNPSKSPDAVSAITSNSNGRWLTLDVTASQESIARTIAEAGTLFGPIDVLVNNAAHAVLSAAEEVPEEAAREEYETNYWGPLKIIRAVLPSMRERKSGTIVKVLGSCSTKYGCDRRRSQQSQVEEHLACSLAIISEA
jgi:NAD(P)-dependent dehydrogenase (short-subunit alcohol dehydrogenase family)